MTVNPIAMQKALGGISYPAAKQDIVDAARSNGADQDIVSALDGIPDKEYETPAEVSKQVGKE
ncbi:DUF2795 domain-containing protein [Streptomyces sp. LP05-1]|uniref:DUF2795 domain-containing protein n=1 Tax=Streptomyces pyxinae TaxID=2970734 RepID=A0ABT2CLX4_9ACTN|nr:DUF2795 domain-containing protein [Streptomyces sp. LP05-1]MCS0638424.1 DUF2795 domain-containing protein [Streptomyces sp. LP05-1]